jgi:hypothetical protein
VEGEIGPFPRQHLTPVPQVPTLAALNEALVAADARDEGRWIAVTASKPSAPPRRGSS